MLVYPIGKTDACQYAAEELRRSGISLVDHPTPEVTHLLLDVPSFELDGQLRSGGDIHRYLERLPPSVTVAGGNLKHTALEDHRVLDLLQDPDYLAVNAAITADCALRVASKEMTVVFFQCPVLVLGWGRIGKCLAQLLRALGAEVTIAARKETDLAMIRALGYQGIPTSKTAAAYSDFRAIFNTIPEKILSTNGCNSSIFIDLASKQGIYGNQVIWARELPGTYAPESSGKLIAGTFLKLARRC